jgi:superfamily I DNA and/or RNA helicase/very-short-patch-repair endonuclease
LPTLENERIDELSKMKKEKYLQIFNYLKEFSKQRSKPVRDIEAQETQYPEKLWLDDIPNNKLFENIIRPEFNTDNEYWLKIRKPKEPTKPVFAQLSETLEQWINKESLANEDDEPTLKEKIEIDGVFHSIEEFPKVIQEHKDYIEQKWIDDIIEFNEKIEIYEKKYAEFEHLNKCYKQLFRIFNKTQQFGEEYELVIGVGLLNFKENSDSPKIFRHILTQRIDINFEYSTKDSHILVSPNIESLPQIETDSIIDLFDQFDSQNIIDAESSVEKYVTEKNIYTIFADGNIDDALQLFAERVSANGNYISSIDKPTTTSSKPQISYSPCLILRKRNTRSFTALYEKILGNIEDAEDEINISSINDLIGIHPENANDFSEGENSSSTSQNEQIYFPKEYNDEQIEIIEKAKRNSKVLVQGPPGTGKSHTIANLICHLLANGKKVLITAHTPRALEVLKDKLPPEFQDLTVNLLSGDSSSIQDLQKSVNSINDELSRANLNTYQTEIEGFGNNLKLTKEEIAFNTNELVKIKEKATRNQEINSNYTGTLTQIAENLEKQSEKFEWYKDDFSDINNEQVHIDLQNYLDLHQNYLNVDISDFEYDIPNTEKLPTVNQVQEYKNLANELLQYYTSKDEHILIQCPDFEKLKTLLKQLREYSKQSGKLQIDFTNDFINTYLNGNSNKWKQTIQYSFEAIERIEKHNLREIDKDIEISYPSKKSIKQLRKDAKTLLDYLKEGNPLSGFTFTLKKAFLPKEIKERLYFIDEVRVNGSPCDTKEEFEIVLNDISIQQNINELSELWNKEIPKTESYLKRFNYFQNIHSEVSKLIVIINESRQKQKEIKDFSELSVTPFDIENLEDLINETEYNHLLQKVKSCKDIIKKAEVSLSNSNCHPIKEKIFEAFKQIDSNAYHKCINQIDALNNGKDDFQAYLRLKENIQKKLPNLFDSIQLSDFTEQDLSKFELALYFRHAQKEINKLMNVDYEQGLRDNLHLSEVKKGRLIAKLAAKKSWYKVVENLQQNRSLRQHLDAWVMAVKKIGKTGRGKRAMKFRKIAQQEMEHCKNSVPCWIMPLYKVAETIQPEQEMYDYVIIDEASQLGPDAIFLLYITKNIIIVGDDKQTSPEYVGVSANSMTPHIKRHLNGIPFSDYYGTEFSFFDHAKFFCDGMTVLQEHFRCMPEIIEFSNKHFYAPDGKGLYPLKQYSENRLEPLKTIFCAKGYTEGKGARIINEPEANEIAFTISKLVDDNRYNDKTFGVITLQGNQQASLIENLLLKTIGEQEYHKRKIVCGNSASFQGDERDIIFLSLVTAHNHNRSALVKPEDERRFNVAVSRAKEQIYLFHSVQLDDLSNTNDLRYKLLDHFKNHNPQQIILNSPIERNIGTQPDPFDSWFEVDVYNDIVRKNLSVIPQYEVAKGRYIIDMVMLLPNGTKIAIECDGDRWHGPEQYQNDIMRQKVLERCGWQFFRVRGYEYYTNRIKALEPLWKMIPKIEKKEPITNLVKENAPSIEIQHEQITNSTNEILPEGEVLEQEIKNIKSNMEQSDISTDDSEVLLRYFNLYKSGIYVMSEEEPLEADYVIPINSNYKNGYLLQCYKSGHINKVFISTLLSKRIGKEYMNGLNKKDELINLELIDSEKIIGIYFNENGNKKFKAHLTENISSRDQLHLQGYKVMYMDFENIDYKIMPLRILESINRLVFQSFTANGKPIDNNYYNTEWSIIKSYASKILPPENKVIEESVNHLKFDFPSLFDSRVELNSVVEIKYLSQNKILKVQLVDYQPEKQKLSNGVQKINIRIPLANSIIGKSIGDKVKVGNTDSFVEIIKID